MPANPRRASLVSMYAKCTMVHERGTVPETRETIAFAGFFFVSFRYRITERVIGGLQSLTSGKQAESITYQIRKYRGGRNS